MITPAPVISERELERRIDLGTYVDGLFSSLGSDVSSFVASGVPQFFNDLPTGTDVLSSLGISSTDLAASPTQALNVPPYGNWTDQGWNVRVHGNIFKQPNISTDDLNSLANKFLIGTSIEDLPEDEQNQARNLTSEIFVVQQDNEEVIVNFVNNVAVNPGTDSGAINAKGGAQNITMPYNTTAEGDFDSFVILSNTTGTNGSYLMPGNETSSLQLLDVYVQGAATTGNATAFLVPTEGITIISDIDDILRVTKIWNPETGILNSFAKPFTAWENMPDIYANWSKSIQNLHFHYLTTTPEQVTKNYMDFIYKTYPFGSFDTRPLNFSDVSATLSIRKFLLTKIFETFPQRKFILVADTSNSDVMSDYPEMATDFPGQVQCILLKNSSSAYEAANSNLTDSDDPFPYDTKGFKGLNTSTYMFFNNAEDLMGLDIANGECVNTTFAQNVTFGEENLPFGAAGALVPPKLVQSLGMAFGAVFFTMALFA
ncbi:hypothetical protein BD289DRAFT_463722 [Coniella lustricola]|uniref:Phosphatidate phosphatase APP1 catalytic domain-containing protein n=1 Tax=Coniella lustricola TaxID=2025994 RepID=A0A2T2ZUC2_9PEZI|nr:hypothetical protein BD289DRAFT_463722 [Coniella lustricola]